MKMEIVLWIILYNTTKDGLVVQHDVVERFKRYIKIKLIAKIIYKIYLNT